MKFILTALATLLCLVSVSQALSPPICPCEVDPNFDRNTCEPLSDSGCEAVDDYCRCCRVCAVPTGGACSSFGQRCVTGAECVFETFWEGLVPLDGHCVAN